MKMVTDAQATALLAALNDLFTPGWTMTPGSEFYAYTLRLESTLREPFIYHRSIKPAHINSEPYRTALQFADEVCERYGRFLLLRPE
jgi:hypothetical protein